MINVNWQTLKEFATQRNTSIQYVEDSDNYYLWAFDGPFCLSSQFYKIDNTSDQQDFENNYKLLSNKSPKTQVVTAAELNDKTLRTFCVFADTNSNGEAIMSVKVPDSGRYIAYGDIEFEQRHFGDYVKSIEVIDIDRLIAWQIALSLDPNASEPVSDETVQGNGYPRYPIIGHYDEKNTADMANSNTDGTIKPGMAMTFQFGITEAQPIGGYGYIPGGMYLKIIAQKADGQTTGYKCQLSIDWAEPDAT